MSVRIRLQRFGKKGQPFYHVVIADGRAPRDGRFIEKIGTYNPLTHPIGINLDFERAFYWLNVGAQPTDTARMILKREGVYLKKHLMGGVKRGAFSAEQAEEKFAAWKEEKARKIRENRTEILNADKANKKKRLEAEAKVKEARATLINEKRQAILAAEAEKAAQEKAQREAEKAAREAEKAAKEAEESAREAEKRQQERLKQQQEEEAAQQSENQEVATQVAVEDVQEVAEPVEQVAVEPNPTETTTEETPAQAEETPVATEE